jgi:SSS family solute:Na+ symporter
VAFSPLDLITFVGFISPGIVAVFAFGLSIRRTPPLAAKRAMALGVPVYGALLWFVPDVAFLHHMMITFIVIAIFIVGTTAIAPSEPRYLSARVAPIDMSPAPHARLAAAGFFAATATLYAVFW